MAYLIHSGSVKDFYGENPPTDDTFGRGYLKFRKDPYGIGPISIFDLKHRSPFGVMGKAEAMFDETVYFFEQMREHGIPTHYLGQRGDLEVAVCVAHIPPKDGWDAWVQDRGRKPFLIPAEVVITNTLTPVASLHKRLRAGKVSPADYGLSAAPGKYETVVLPQPAITTSTKLAAVDEYRDDLFDRAGLTQAKRDVIRQTAIRANEITRADAMQVGLDIADGKFEFIMGPNGEILICDTYATSDENRVLAQARDGRWVDLSKQFPRNLYTINGYRELLEAAQGSGVPFAEWPVPELLDDPTMRVVERTYAVVRQELCRKPMGLDLQTVATEAQDTLDRFTETYHRDIVGNKIQ